MSRQTKKIINPLSLRAGLLSVSLLAAASSGCVDADTTLLTEGFIVLEGTEVTNDDGDVIGVACDVPTSPEAANIRASVLRINLQQTATGAGLPYSMIASNLLTPSDEYSPIGTSAELRVDQNTVAIDRVSFTFPADDNFPGFTGLDFEAPFQATVSSGGFYFALVDMIPQSQQPLWEGAVASTGASGDSFVPGIVKIQTFGRTIAGVNVESNIIRMPFEVCASCNAPSTDWCVPKAE